MKLILSHFKDCPKLKEEEDCICCHQFLQIIAEHRVQILCKGPFTYDVSTLGGRGG